MIEDSDRVKYKTDRAAVAFLLLAMGYLLTGILFGVIGSLQYVLPSFLKDALSFQKSRPLHVYLVIAWIFTGAQGALYYYMPRVAGKKLYWEKAVSFHFWMQVAISVAVISCFFAGKFGGREYLEFPPAFGLVIILSWIPFAINFFATLRPDYKKAPVYIWSWSAGIVFFFITMSESYLWLIDYFRSNIVRDITVQWKALGSMVGSWNMLVYGTGMYLMSQLHNDKRVTHKPEAFFFFFLGLTNLMFNWGHHTYIVPAAAWVKTVAYAISMTELLIFGHILYMWRKTVTAAQKNFNRIPFRFLSFADIWIFINLGLAIAISIPALNFFTHGTHITVAHAMGATIGINSMILFASVFYIIKQERAMAFYSYKKLTSAGIYITNAALLVFWISLIGMGLVKVSSNLHHEAFATMMKQCEPYFKVFSASGIFILVGISIIIVSAFLIVFRKQPKQELTEIQAIRQSQLAQLN
jgi:nitric oxide reductase subunit B